MKTLSLHLILYTADCIAIDHALKFIFDVQGVALDFSSSLGKNGPDSRRSNMNMRRKCVNHMDSLRKDREHYIDWLNVVLQSASWLPGWVRLLMQTCRVPVVSSQVHQWLFTTVLTTLLGARRWCNLPFRLAPPATCAIFLLDLAMQKRSAFQPWWRLITTCPCDEEPPLLHTIHLSCSSFFFMPR